MMVCTSFAEETKDVVPTLIEVEVRFLEVDQEDVESLNFEWTSTSSTSSFRNLHEMQAVLAKTQTDMVLHYLSSVTQ